MILAAGLGTRLRPLTDTTPKALIEVGGVAMLERVARRLVAAGVDRLIINIHHHADAIEAFVEERDGFGVPVVLSREEDEALETGGGLLRAAPHFRRDAPFFLHNVDIITDIPLEALYASHRDAVASAGARGDVPPVATLAVHERDTRRFLLFDQRGLCGWENLGGAGPADRMEARPPEGAVRRLAFAGIHVLEPRFLDLLEESGRFSIIGPYMRLAGAGAVIRGEDVTGRLWLEIGNAERLARARAWAGEASASGQAKGVGRS